MSTSKATPGPWRVEGVDILSGSMVVAYVTGTDEDAEHQSDARLIAAAPELRDALRSAADTLSLVRSFIDEQVNRKITGKRPNFGEACRRIMDEAEPAEDFARALLARLDGEGK